MLKRVLLMFLAFVLAFSATEASAASVVTESMVDLALEAQHYYNTSVAYADMTIKRVNSKMYEIYYYSQSGRWLTHQLYQTDWGTWNLGTTSIDDYGIKKDIIGGGTDWEYVFRVFNPISQNLEFTGGNHGSEELKSISMYDAVTGEGFSLETGESKYVNRLVIEEKTTIMLANVDYLPYAEVTRVYTIVGKTINLDSTITFTRDVQMALSYSSMASVHKDFSSCCMFGGENGVMTGPKGTFTNEKLGNYDAMICYLSGDDPTVRVTVGIYNKQDMTDSFSNKDKTFLWDMSEQYNKLYFSKYSMSTLERVMTGTVWSFRSYWTVDFE